MDYELEIGVVIGKPLPLHQRLNANDADEHVFGLVLLNDWSGKPILYRLLLFCLKVFSWVF